MGSFDNYCAGADMKNLPHQPIKNILLPLPHNFDRIENLLSSLKFIKLSGAERFIINSGGFQCLQAELRNKDITFNANEPLNITKEKLNISPLHLIRAITTISKVRKPEFFVTLDWPVKNLKGEIAEVEFIGKIKRNIDLTKETLKLRQKYCPDVEVYVAIQIYTIKQFHYFIKEFNDLPFDGISLPIRNFGTFEVSEFLAEFYKLGIRKVHLLGTSQYEMIAMSSYLARHYFKRYSLDSTSWWQSAKYGNYLHPLDLQNIDLNKYFLKKSICSCPYCHDITIDDIANMEYGDKLMILSRHNWKAIEKVSNELFEIASDRKEFFKEIMRRTESADKRLSILRGISNFERSI